MSTDVTLDSADRLRPYVAGVAVDWLVSTPESKHRRIDGSLVFVDISGFTTLTERLAAKGKVGAEELSDILSASFATLLEEAYGYGASLVKWGGDAVLLLFEGAEHSALAARAAFEMRRTMRRIGRLQTSVGTVQLKMSVGIDSGAFDFFLGGRRHRELLVAGPAASATAVMEQTAEAGEIVVSPATAALLPPGCVGAAKGGGFLLRSAPRVDPRSRWWPPGGDDVQSCLDPAIRDHLLTEVGDSEHRQVAVGFVEVSGVDELLVQQGPGAVASALHDLLVLVQDECSHHRVTFWETDISKDGFKIMLVAGAPRSSGRDEDGMLRATRAILDQHRGPVRVRIGINSGRVFNGGFGPSFRRTWSVKGDAVNLAARVMGKAGDGQLLATETLLRRASVRIEAELLEPFMVKGKKHPVRAAVVQTVTAELVTDVAESGAFVGRREDLDVLLEAAAAAGAGNGSAVAVVGAAGLGKSRLVDHLCRRLGIKTAVLRAFGDVYEATTAYYTARRLLRAALDIAPDASSEEVVARLRRAVAARAAHLEPLLPLLAVAFGATLPDTTESVAVLEQFRRARTAALVVELLRATVTTPTVFVVDDVHAADDASLELLGHLAADTARRPWMLLLAGRALDESVAPTARRLELAPLPAAEAGQLVLETPGGDALAPHVVRTVVERGEGNPLFLRELTAAAATDADDLPGSLEELLAAQVDDLPPEPRQLLRTVSVLGIRFDPEVAGELLDRTPEPAEWSVLQHFLATHGDGSKRFRSGLVRDAAYEGLPFRRRVELHGRAAAALEHRWAGRAEEVAEPLSLHSLEAQRYDDAWRYSIVAGRRARHVYANVEALTFYRRALTASRRLESLVPEQVASVHEAVGDLQARLAQLDGAMTAYRTARQLTPRSDGVSRARLALSTALVSARAGSPVACLRWLSAAEKDVATSTPSAGTDTGQEITARCLVERALIRYRQGRHREAAALAARALTEAESAGADFVVARSLWVADINDVAVGASGDDQRVQRALELFERCGDLTFQAHMWIQLGIHAYYRGEWDLAVERYGRARELHQRTGDDWNAAIPAANVAEILVDQGRLAEAQPAAEDALRTWRVSGTPWDIGFGAALLARLRARSGRFAEAMELLEEAVSAYSASNERFDLLDAELRIVELLVLQGAAGLASDRLDNVERRLRAAFRDAGVLTGDGTPDELPPTVPQAAQVLRWRGYISGQLGERQAAAEHFARSLDFARSRGAVHDEAMSLDGLAWTGTAPGAASDAAAQRDGLFARLGIVWTPTIPQQRIEVDLNVTVPRQRSRDTVTTA